MCACITAALARVCFREKVTATKGGMDDMMGGWLRLAENNSSVPIGREPCSIIWLNFPTIAAFRIPKLDLELDQEKLAGKEYIHEVLYRCDSKLTTACLPASLTPGTSSSRIGLAWVNSSLLEAGLFPGIGITYHPAASTLCCGSDPGRFG